MEHKHKTRRLVVVLAVVVLSGVGIAISADDIDQIFFGDPLANVEYTEGSALAVLDELEVRGRAPRTEYSREQFGGSWGTAPSGCDVRNYILVRDLEDVLFDDDGCLVDAGTLHDPYTGTRIDFIRGPGTSAEVQIDHVVALSDAWQKGAQTWSEAQRVQFHDDPLNLLAVDGPANQAKGDGDAATWLPPNRGYRCAFVARQIAVKYAYDLWVTSAERDAKRRVLAGCPDQRLPTP